MVTCNGQYWHPVYGGLLGFAYVLKLVSIFLDFLLPAGGLSFLMQHAPFHLPPLMCS